MKLIDSLIDKHFLQAYMQFINDLIRREQSKI